MNDNWKNAIVTKIALAVYVAPGTGSDVHNNRPFHGLVINTDNSVKEYLFSDGTVLKTESYDVFYLPKGSSYKVNSLVKSGCYAINFDMAQPFCDKPFVISFRNSENILKLFKESENMWRQQSSFYNATVIRNVYDIILLMNREVQKKYMPGEHEMIIQPAVEKIKNEFTKSELSVKELADVCSISEVYFRKLFINKFGVTPKEYIIMMRINYAKQLLESGQFSVSETAGLCGYFEPCHFSREFAKREGIPPAKYKKKSILLN